jgi:hypothetical protein
MILYGFLRFHCKGQYSDNLKLQGKLFDVSAKSPFTLILLEY